MSENPISDLYVLDEEGNEYKKIEPKTIALAVDDETNNRNVQEFIDNGITKWDDIQGGKEYATASLIYESFDKVNDELEILDSNSVRYLDTWDATNQIDFSSIELPVKKGFSYKVIGEETSFGERTFKPGDLIIINRRIEKDDVINNEDVDLILGYGNEGTKIYRYVADILPHYSDLENYENPIEKSIIIIANDENHNNLLSFYEYIFGIDYDYVVTTYDELLNIENSNYNIVKVITDETHDNETSYYKWSNQQWNYISEIGYNWIYMFSRQEITEGIFRVKGSVATYADLPSSGQAIGDVYNVLDTGSNYCWTEDGWDKLSETIDLSNYYTKEEVDELIQEKDSLPEQAGHEGEILYTNGNNAYWSENPPAVILKKW